MCNDSAINFCYVAGFVSRTKARVDVMVPTVLQVLQVLTLSSVDLLLTSNS